jgi:hypothetical protein
VDDSVRPGVDIKVTVSSDCIAISDNASGISAGVAQAHFFEFGRASGDEDSRDRLSVYGIGLKRAIFKLGRDIVIRSDHIDGGFDMHLNVDEWETDPTQPWTFPLTTRQPADKDSCGTCIAVSRLNEDAIRRLSDGLFINQLRESIARTYAFYMPKYVNIYVNEEIVDQITFDVGANRTTQVFAVDGVSCAVSAAIAEPQGGVFRDRTAGWFVFCNGRNAIYADKTPLTGWSTPGSGLPIFQPKHRLFVGTVFFVSQDPEKLPWTTTKSGINEDSSIWQEAKRRMIVVGRDLISFLDGRYSDEGTEVATADLREVAQARVSLLTAAISESRSRNLLSQVNRL